MHLRHSRLSAGLLLSVMALSSCGGAAPEQVQTRDRNVAPSASNVQYVDDYATDASGAVTNPREARFIGSSGHIVLLDQERPWIRLLDRSGTLLWSGDGPHVVGPDGDGPEAIGVSDNELLVLQRGRMSQWRLDGDSLGLELSLSLADHLLPMGAIPGCSAGWLVLALDDNARPPSSMVAGHRAMRPEVRRNTTFLNHDMVLWTLPGDGTGTRWGGHAGNLIDRAESGIVLLHRSSPRQAGVVLECDCDGLVERSYAEHSLAVGDSFAVVLPRPRALEWTAGLVGMSEGFVIAQQRWFSPAIHGVAEYHYITELLRFAGGEYLGSVLIFGQWKLLDRRVGRGILMSRTEPSVSLYVLEEASLDAAQLRRGSPQ